MRDLDFLKIHLFVLRNTDTTSFHFLSVTLVFSVIINNVQKLPKTKDLSIHSPLYSGHRYHTVDIVFVIDDPITVDIDLVIDDPEPEPEDCEKV